MVYDLLSGTLEQLSALSSVFTLQVGRMHICIRFRFLATVAVVDRLLTAAMKPCPQMLRLKQCFCFDVTDLGMEGFGGALCGSKPIGPGVAASSSLRVVWLKELYSGQWTLILMAEKKEGTRTQFKEIHLKKAQLTVAGKCRLLRELYTEGCRAIWVGVKLLGMLTFHVWLTGPRVEEAVNVGKRKAVTQNCCTEEPEQDATADVKDGVLEDIESHGVRSNSSKIVEQSMKPLLDFDCAGAYSLLTMVSMVVFPTHTTVEKDEIYV
ncbi:hypothetical protein Ancab_012725 [Ancistrocladus abbreviatus]